MADTLTLLSVGLNDPGQAGSSGQVRETDSGRESFIMPGKCRCKAAGYIFHDRLMFIKYLLRILSPETHKTADREESILVLHGDQVLLPIENAETGHIETQSSSVVESVNGYIL